MTMIYFRPGERKNTCFIIAFFLLRLGEVHCLGVTWGEEGKPCPSPHVPEPKREEAPAAGSPLPS